VQSRSPACSLLLILCFHCFASWAAPQTASDRAADLDKLSADAAAAREAGRADEAMQNYKRALKLRPDWDEGWWYLGTISYDADHYAEAIPAFKNLVERNPKIGAAWGFLGLCEFEVKDYENSLPHLQRAEDLGYEESPEIRKVARYHLALLLNRKGQFDKAVEVLAAEFGKTRMPEQIKVALGMALLRVRLLPGQMDPSKDALIHAAGDAEMLIVDGQLDAAAQALRKLLTAYPGTPYLHYAYGRALAGLAKNDEAAAQFREETRIFPESAAPHQALGEILQQLGRKTEAASELDAAKKLFDSPPQVESAIARYYGRNLAGPDSASAQTVGRTPQETSKSSTANFDELARDANADRDAGQTDAAIAAYQRALQARSDWEEGWRSLGTLFFMSRRYSEAASALTNAVALDAKHGEAWAMLGLSEFEDKDYKNALIHLRRGEQLGLAGNANARRFAKYHLALLLNLNGDFDEATDTLIPEVGPSPLESQIKIALGIALLRVRVLPEQTEPAKQALIATAGDAAALLAQSKYDQAFAILKQMCSDYPDTPYVHYAYGNALAFTSQYDEAEAQLREEIRFNPGSSSAYVRLATVALQMHKPEEALQSAEHAVQMAPDLAEAHYVLGRARLDLGKVSEAIDELEVARKLAPNSPEVHFTLARAYAKAKRTDDAEQERAAFERLNALAQQQRATHGSQAYGATHGEIGLTPVGQATEPRSSPE